jgi:hypothetical protein
MQIKKPQHLCVKKLNKNLKIEYSNVFIFFDAGSAFSYIFRAGGTQDLPDHIFYSVYVVGFTGNKNLVYTIKEPVFLIRG